MCTEYYVVFHHTFLHVKITPFENIDFRFFVLYKHYNLQNTLSVCVFYILLSATAAAKVIRFHIEPSIESRTSITLSCYSFGGLCASRCSSQVFCELKTCNLYYLCNTFTIYGVREVIFFRSPTDFQCHFILVCPIQNKLNLRDTS